MSDGGMAYCAFYVSLDAPPDSRLVVTRPYFRTPAGATAVLQCLRLSLATGAVVGGPLPALRRFLSDLKEADYLGDLAASGDPIRILAVVKALVAEHQLSIEYEQIGPGPKPSQPIEKMSEASFRMAVTTLVQHHLREARALGLPANRSTLDSSVKGDNAVAILTVCTHAKRDSSTLTPSVKIWDFGTTTILPELVETSMAINPENLGFTSIGSLDMAWSLWVRTGRPWSYSS